MRRPHFSLLAGFLLALVALPAAALQLDFSEFRHGDIIRSSQGVNIRTTNIGGGPDLGVGFDTNARDTADRDLERGRGWSGGNLSSQTDFGVSLIIQENSRGCDASSCSRPDDEGSRPAGSIDLDFSSLGSFEEFSFDVIDVENVTAEPGSVEFYFAGRRVETVGFLDFLNDPTVAYGDNSANRISNVVSGESFDRVVIRLGGSGAIDNIRVAGAAPVPEPSAALLFGLGAVVVGGRFGRRDASAS